MGWGSAIGSAIGAVGSLIGGGIASNNANKQYEMQKEFAQNGIRWKVADAKAAGIHPLAALGAQTFSYNPIAVGDNGIADALSQMGQGIDRAVAAKQTAEERALEQDFVDKQRELDIRQKEKNIQLLDSEIYRNNSAAYESLKRASIPPAMPSTFRKGFDGQGDAKSGNTPGLEVAGGVDKPFNKYAWTVNPEGKMELQPSQDYAQSYEDKAFIEWIPWINAFLKEVYYATTGKPLNGYVYNSRLHRWVPAPKFPECRGKYTKKYRYK